MHIIVDNMVSTAQTTDWINIAIISDVDATGRKGPTENQSKYISKSISNLSLIFLFISAFSDIIGILIHIFFFLNLWQLYSKIIVVLKKKSQIKPAAGGGYFALRPSPQTRKVTSSKYCICRHFFAGSRGSNNLSIGVGTAGGARLSLARRRRGDDDHVWRYSILYFFQTAGTRQ